MAVFNKGIFRIGTSGIAVPGNKLSRPEEFQSVSRLNYFASFFNSIEINSSFYKIPRAVTFDNWSRDVPDDFRFTVKLFKEITHAKHLKCDLDKIRIFLDAAETLAGKKGCLLIQFPGSIDFEFYSQVEEILEGLEEADHGNQWRKALEFRNSSWYVGETFEMLKQFNATLVLQDIPKCRCLDFDQEAEFIYLRYHGPTGNYRGSYEDEFLVQQSKRIHRWLNYGKDVYAYFNNTAGNAFENAISLRNLVIPK